jgi:hypothetical protein
VQNSRLGGADYYVTGPGFNTALPTQGEMVSVNCSVPAITTCSGGYTVNTLNSLPNALNYGMLLQNDLNLFGPTESSQFEQGQTMLYVVPAGSTSGITLPIPTIDCQVQTVGTTALCGVSTAAVQSTLSGYVNSDRQLDLQGTATADMTATNLTVTGTDYQLTVYFNQGDFTEPGSNEVFTILAAGGIITAVTAGNSGTAGPLPLPAIMLPTVGSSSDFTLSMPAIPALSPDAGTLDSFVLEQFTDGTAPASVIVPEPNSGFLVGYSVAFGALLVNTRKHFARSRTAEKTLQAIRRSSENTTPTRCQA